MKILYIHGLGATPKTFNYLVEVLPKHEAYFAEYDATQPIKESVLQMASFVPTGEYAIVGHSLGGLIASILLGGNYQAGFGPTHAITISSPFGGSREAVAMAFMFPESKVMLDLIPGSTALSHAAQGARQNRRLHSVISTAGSVPTMQQPNDGVVSVESQRASPGLQYEVAANHFEIVQDPTTAKIIKSILF